jgi:hypothetical protein
MLFLGSFEYWPKLLTPIRHHLCVFSLKIISGQVKSTEDWWRTRLLTIHEIRDSISRRYLSRKALIHGFQLAFSSIAMSTPFYANICKLLRVNPNLTAECIGVGLKNTRCRCRISEPDRAAVAWTLSK